MFDPCRLASNATVNCGRAHCPAAVFDLKGARNHLSVLTRMRKRVGSLSAGLALLAVCFMPVTAFAQEGHHQSGVTGQVFISVCPVVRLGENCDRPYPTGITIITDDGQFVTEVVTDEEGRFEVLLKPGDYILIPKGAGEATFPRVDELAVHVEKKQFTAVTIVYDSGIR